MQTKKTFIRCVIALFACTMFICAFAAAPYVHKHSVTEQVPLQDYDASCSFVKAEKNSAGVPSQHLLGCVSLLLFFMILHPLVARRTEDDEAVYSIFTRKVQTPRAPPAC